MNHYFSHNSCYQAGLILRSKPETTSLPQDFVAAFQYFNKGCLLGNFRSCYEVGAAYEQGRGVNKDLKLAEEFRKKAEEMSKTH